MAMNRQTKRMLQRQGQITSEGLPTTAKQQQRPGPKPQRERVGPRQYTREVRGELRKVAWPTRQEVMKYSLIVLVAVVLLTSMIAALDFVFTRAVFFLFDS